MTRDDIIRMAREAGFLIDEASRQHQPKCISFTHYLIDDELERFAALVAAAEREACAEKGKEVVLRRVRKNADAFGTAEAVFQAIRARGQA